VGSLAFPVILNHWLKKTLIEIQLTNPRGLNGDSAKPPNRLERSMTEPNKISFHGPFHWCRSINSGTGRTSPDFGEFTKRTGVYLWTIEKGGDELIHYVGHTFQDFRKRHQQHCSEFVKGHYGIYDARYLREGVRKALFKGVWNVKGAEKKKVREHFIENRGEILSWVGPYLDQLRIWVAAIDDREWSGRLETAIYEKIISDTSCRSIRLLPKMESHTFHHTTQPKQTVHLQLTRNFDGLSSEIRI